MGIYVYVESDWQLREKKGFIFEWEFRELPVFLAMKFEWWNS